MNKKVKLLKFSATWCNRCRPLIPTFNELRKQFGDVEFTSIDIDENEETTTKYSIKSIPTIVFLQDDVESFRLVGFHQKSTIENKINELL